MWILTTCCSLDFIQMWILTTWCSLDFIHFWIAMTWISFRCGYKLLITAWISFRCGCIMLIIAWISFRPGYLLPVVAWISFTSGYVIPIVAWISLKPGLRLPGYHSDVDAEYLSQCGFHSVLDCNVLVWGWTMPVVHDDNVTTTHTVWHTQDLRQVCSAAYNHPQHINSFQMIDIYILVILSSIPDRSCNQKQAFSLPNSVWKSSNMIEPQDLKMNEIFFTKVCIMCTSD